MADNAKLNSGDNKSEVAYRMALNLWHASNGNLNPSLENKDVFLDLVNECVWALNSRRGH